jgi:hypothetical protein
LSRHGAAARQYRLKKAGLSALKWPNDRHQTRTGDAVLMIDCVHYRPPLALHRAAKKPLALHAKTIDSLDPAASLKARFSEFLPRRGSALALSTATDLLSCAGIVARTGAARKGGLERECRRSRIRRQVLV